MEHTFFKLIMFFFDTHFHLDNGNSTSEVYVAAANEAGVELFLAAGVDMATSGDAGRFADGKLRWFAAGVHPHEAGAVDISASEFAEFMENPGFAAFGEVGLDYYYDHSDRGVQRAVFAEFAETASRRSAPMIVHCRPEEGADSAFLDTFEILSDFAADGGRFVLHCFTGTPEWVERFLELGAFFGMAGIVTFPKASNVRDSLTQIPLDRLLLETDAPWLAPAPFRGKQNHSKYLPVIAEKVAEVKGVEVSVLAETTTRNGLELFVDWRTGRVSGEERK